jgi:hypothetical protein
MPVLSTTPSFFDSEEIARRIAENDNLSLKDLLSIERSHISPALSDWARNAALVMLEKSRIRIVTLCKDDGAEYEHLYPVLRRVPREQWVTPGGYIVYEPEYTSSPRHNYYPNYYKPVEIVLSVPTSTPNRVDEYKWSLIPGSGSSSHDGHELCGFLPSDNKTGLCDNLYTLFQCHYERHELNREGPTKVFYKSEGDRVKLLSASIPLRVLGPVLQMQADEVDNVSVMFHRSSTVL